MLSLKDLSCALEEGCFSESAYRATGDPAQNIRRLLRWFPIIGKKIITKLSSLCKNYLVLLRFTQKVTNIGDADFLSSADPLSWEYHSCHKWARLSYHIFRGHFLINFPEISKIILSKFQNPFSRNWPFQIGSTNNLFFCQRWLKIYNFFNSKYWPRPCRFL